MAGHRLGVWWCQPDKHAVLIGLLTEPTTQLLELGAEEQDQRYPWTEPPCATRLRPGRVFQHHAPDRRSHLQVVATGVKPISMQVSMGIGLTTHTHG
jgi:hypothetical protein